MDSFHNHGKAEHSWGPWQQRIAGKCGIILAQSPYFLGWFHMGWMGADHSAALENHERCSWDAELQVASAILLGCDIPNPVNASCHYTAGLSAANGNVPTTEPLSASRTLDKAPRSTGVPDHSISSLVATNGIGIQDGHPHAQLPAGSCGRLHVSELAVQTHSRVQGGCRQPG